MNDDKALGEEDDDYLEQLEVDAEDEADEEDAKKEAERVAKKRAEEHPGEEPPFAKTDVVVTSGPPIAGAVPHLTWSAPRVPGPANERDWIALQRLAGSKSEAESLRMDSRAVGDWAVWRRVGIKYQDMLYALARLHNVRIAVETGVLSGVSTRFLLEAIRPDGTGPDGGARHERLFSCDPLPTIGREISEAGVLGDPGWTFLNEPSSTALPKFARHAPAWDLFLHDSDHRLECMVFELEFAWHLVRDGGVIVCDDWNATFEGTFAGAQHGAWEAFAERHGLLWWKMGTAAVAVRTPGVERLAPEEALHAAATMAVLELKRLQPSVTAQLAGYAK